VERARGQAGGASSGSRASTRPPGWSAPRPGTGPLGADLGDLLASARDEGGLGLGTLGTSLAFLGASLALVTYLSRTGRDRIERIQPLAAPAADVHLL